jgi:tetratricopeptide (TPR) repeat protein
VHFAIPKPLEEVAMAPRRIYLKSDTVGTDEVLTQSQGQPHEALSVFPESVHRIRKQISRAIAQGDLIGAIALLNRLVINEIATAEDYNNRGLVYFWTGSSQKAFWDFNRAITLNPELPAAYNNRANYYAAHGAQENALEDYERTIDLDPFHVLARINRAITLRELGQYEAALDGLDEALLFRQKQGDIYAERGRTFHLRGDWNCAIADYRRALLFFPINNQNANSASQLRRRQIMAWLRQLDHAA